MPITSASAHRALSSRTDGDAPPSSVGADCDLPSAAHLQILGMMSEGYDDEMIARRLGMEMGELRALVMHAASHLGACNRFQLALRAREEQWI